MKSISHSDLHALCLGEPLLIGVKGEEPSSAEMQRRGDVQDVRQTVSVLPGESRAQIFRELMHHRPIAGHNLNHFCPQETGNGVRF